MGVSKDNDYIKYLSLLNPFHMFTATEKEFVAPGGKLALSKNPANNEAIWNTLSVVAGAGILSYVAAKIANKNSESEITKARNKAELANINSIRPVITPNDNLDYTTNITDRPGEEIEQINAITKKKRKELEAKNSLLFKRASSIFRDVAPYVARWAVPVIAAPLTAYTVSAIVNEKEKENLAEKLDKESVELQNLQDAVDTDIMVRRGLLTRTKDDKRKKRLEALANAKAIEMVKEASDNGSKSAPIIINKAQSAVLNIYDRLSDILAKSNTFLRNVGVRMPLTAAATIAVLGASGGAYLLHKRDDNVKKLKYLKKHMLGENKLLESPEISMELTNGIELPSTQKKMYQRIEGVPETKALPNTLGTDTSLIADYVNPPTVKKDALF